MTGRGVLQVGKIYPLENGLSVLIESEESVGSPMPWDFTGRDTTFKKYLHFSTRGYCREGSEYNVKETP
jgi:hypothetical protein